MSKKSKIKKDSKTFGFLELFLPIVADIIQINSESNTKEVSNNAWSLTDEQYNKVIKKITSSRGNSKDDQNIIIID